jgi:hypothetical protein
MYSKSEAEWIWFITGMCMYWIFEILLRKKNIWIMVWVTIFWYMLLLWTLWSCQDEWVSYLPEWRTSFFPLSRVTSLWVIMNFTIYITCTRTCTHTHTHTSLPCILSMTSAAAVEVGLPVGIWSSPVCCPVIMMPSLGLLLWLFPKDYAILHNVCVSM